MAEGGSFDLGHRLDIKHILSEAKHRWLRPAEVCEVLRNQEKFHISAEAPNKPVSGSVFLFDRKVLRYFRKDGHNWRKKKDGKTVKEAHEKLKVGSVDMLNCYYAHGEDNENFQRRSYWLLEQDLMHIVFVHYMEVKGNKTNISCVSNSVGAVSKSENDRSLSSSFRGTSPTSTLSSTCDDVESGGYHQAHSRLNSYPDSPLTEDSHSTQSSSCTQLFSPGEAAYKQGSGCFLPVRAKCQTPNNEARPFYTYPEQEEQSLERNIQMFPSNEETDIATNPNLENGMTSIGNGNYSLIMKKPLGSLRTDETLKKVDSFSSWIVNELGEVDELDMQPSDAILWNTMGSEYEHNMAAQLHMDTHMLNPSISSDQIFSISDFLPNWAYSNLETKVLISGIFLKSEQELAKYRWSVMFGEVEVPAEVLMDGILSCCAPPHIPGVVPFYVTCSNRLACSELREFKYRSGPEKNISSLDVNGYIGILMHLYQRFEMILCLEPVGSPLSARNDFEKQSVINKIVSLIEEDNSQDAKLASESNTLCGKVIGEQLLQKQLKEKFYSWLLLGVTSDGKGLMIIDKWGQSVLHLAAALGFNWAFQPIIESGVNIDFRDVNGWAALHWAAFYGREETVAVLVSLGAAPGALTDPSTEYPQGRTPSDLSYSSGHKGISGFLGETFLTTHLSTLTLNDGDTTEESGLEAIQTVTARLAVPTTGEDVPETLSLKDSIAAVCNATQAAARIHQIFRIQSFQRKQLLIEQESGEWLDSDEQAISLLAAKTSRLGQSGGTANAAALIVQKKYRGWKKRKEFLLIRQKIVKIQAHVRGHQARKKYKPIIWSVGILEKVILRWRRKGTGLRGFRPDGIQKEPNEGNSLPPPEDDYDYLKEGRKQSEQRMQKALARVKSMAQYPEARAQYRRLLTAGEVFRENKDASDGIPDNMEDLMYPGDDLIDISSLLDDDTFMPQAF